MAVVIDLVGDQLTKGKSPKGRLRYTVDGAATATEAYQLVNAVSPVSFSGLVKQDIDVEEIGTGYYECAALYGIAEMGQPGQAPTWSFEIGTENFKLTQSRGTRNYPTGTDCDHKGAIGVRKDGHGSTIEGADIFIPVFTWEETHCYPAATVASYAFLQLAEGLVAHTNVNPFRIWQACELILLGISGASRGEEAVPVTFKFASSRTRLAFSIHDITGIDKKGWEYLWVEYWPKENSTALTSRPKAVHVEQIYEEADFTALGLADPWS